MRKAKLRHTSALVDIVVGARLNAALRPRLDRNENVVLTKRALEQRNANKRVLQFTARKRRTRTTVLRAASVAVAHRRVAAVLVLAALVLLVVLDRRFARTAVARRRLRRVRRATAASAAALVLAKEDRAALALLRRVDLDHAALVQLRAADRARLAHPALRIARRVAVVAGNRAERKLERVVEARARALHDDNFVDHAALLDLERRTRLGVEQRQSDVLALRLEQIARHSQARRLLGRAQAVAAVDHLARLHNAQRTVLQNVTKFIGQFPTIVGQLSES